MYSFPKFSFEAKSTSFNIIHNFQNKKFLDWLTGMKQNMSLIKNKFGALCGDLVNYLMWQDCGHSPFCGS